MISFSQGNNNGAAQSDVGDASEVKLEEASTTMTSQSAGDDQMSQSQSFIPRAQKPKATSVFCDSCNITLNSQIIYEAHCKGAKHQKRLTLINTIIPNTQVRVCVFC
jgi:hypothetical protein